MKGENAMSQERKFIAMVVENLPEIPEDVKQGWIENPAGLRKALKKALRPPDIINCDADPFVPEKWKVEFHNKQGQLEWDPDNIHLFLSGSQKGGGWIKGHDLREELGDKPVLNANVLDYLLSHPELIPESWKDKAIFFWGTIYSCSGDYACVRCLCWRSDGWVWGRRFLNAGFYGSGPAVLS